jgi:predicted RNase H-like nuclease (RuvC/YqgF family)
MYKKIFLVLFPIYIFLFSSCSNKTVKQEKDPTQKQNETIKETSFLGKIMVGAVTFLGTKGNIGKTLKATKFGGTASAYLVGRRLSDMQKRYKEKEEELIANILKIDKESTELKEQNNKLLIELMFMKDKIEKLKENKVIEKQEKIEQQTALKSKLQQKREVLKLLLAKNKRISKKIALSKSKANEYKYTKEDKKEILKSVAFLEKNSQSYSKNINKSIDSINKTIAMF